MTLSWGQGWLVCSFLLTLSTDSLRISRNQNFLQPVCDRFCLLWGLGLPFPIPLGVPGNVGTSLHAGCGAQMALVSRAAGHCTFHQR